MTDFDMPLEGSWEVRGGWVTHALAQDLSWPLPVAAGFVGNLGYESAEFRTLQEMQPQVPGSAGGYGWAQWTGPRRRNFEVFCASNGFAPTSDEGNYRFCVFELTGAQPDMPHSDFLAFANRMRATATVKEACHFTHEWYERPQDVLDGTFTSGSRRLALALRALNGAMIIPPTPDVIVDVPSNDPDALCRAMQRALGVTPDGDPGPITREAMRRWRER